MKNFKVLVIFFGVLFCCVISTVEGSDEQNRENSENGETETEKVQEGRSFVHHAMKRLAILLPAFMFKLGIMFTMILVSMITSTKGLLVSTLLLALGVGHFIANRFSATPTHAHISLPHVHAGWHHPHFVDRSDTVVNHPANIVGSIPAGYAQEQAYHAWRV